MIPELLAKIRECIERAADGKELLDCDELEADLFKTINEIWPKGLTGHELACKTALQGIPTESLPDVKKAWLAWKIWGKFGYCYTPEFSHKTCIGINISGFGDEEFEYVDEGLIIKAAIALRSRGADFGELNALLDSIKEER